VSKFNAEYLLDCLKAYSIGLLGYIVFKVLVPGFTSRQDMKMPIRYEISTMIVSLVLNVVLAGLNCGSCQLSTNGNYLLKDWG
jgi:peptidoglycan biosynthesis protein MviN/MurJ (putative lipid II flippase)